ncbi:STAS domain-containing protein [Rhodanobacter ginsengiterrae]|uniref:STAS domain-containing protein n=1 Tax=Rhodanobacter ginsengiterrae TaxID=2008451 RepID=UPI003CE90D1B
MTDAGTSRFQLDTAVPATLVVAGELSFDTASAALEAIQSALGDTRIQRLDLARVSRADSAGLACVLAVLAGAGRRGQVLEVVHIPSGMQTLAQVCEVDQLIA